MKLMRFGKTGEERPGIELNNGQQLDVSAFGEDFNQFFLQKIVLPNLPYGWKEALVKFECCPITNVWATLWTTHGKWCVYGPVMPSTSLHHCQPLKELG